MSNNSDAEPGSRTVSLGCLAALLAGVMLVWAPARAQQVAIVDVTVLPMEGPSRIPHCTVVVKDGVIETVGAADTVEVPAGALRIDGHGRYLMPGLSDMHTHLLGLDTEAHKSPEVLDRRMRFALLAYLATGVTVVRDMSGSPTKLRYRTLVSQGEVVGPRMYVATPILEGEKRVWDFSVQILDPAQVEPLIAGFARDGYDFIKIYHTLSAPVFNAIMVSAKRHGLKVVGHVPFDVGIEGVLSAGQYSVEHLRGYDFDRLDPALLVKDGGRSPERLGSWLKMSDARMEELAQETVRAQAWNTPTLAVVLWLADSDKRATLVHDPSYSLLPPEVQAELPPGPMDRIFPLEARRAMLAAFPRQRHFVKVLHDAGAGLLIGTDSLIPYLVKGFTPIDEIGELVAAGISPEDALRAATADAARFLGKSAESGTVAVGKRTDLILLDDDPLRDVANLWKLNGVLRLGHWHSKAALIEEIEQMESGRNSGSR